MLRSGISSPYELLSAFTWLYTFNVKRQTRTVCLYPQYCKTQFI